MKLCYIIKENKKIIRIYQKPSGEFWHTETVYAHESIAQDHYEELRGEADAATSNHGDSEIKSE